MRTWMVGLGWSIVLVGCSDASPALVSDLVLAGSLVESLGGASEDDLWLMGTDDVRHWDGESLVVVPDADNFTPMYQFPVHTTPGTLWYITYPPHRVESLSRDGTRQDHSQHLPAGASPVSLATGGGAVWTTLSDGRALDVATGTLLELPGGVWAMTVIDARDVWLYSLEGQRVGHWDGAQLSVHEMDLQGGVRPPAFLRNDDGEAVALVRNGFTSRGGGYANQSSRAYLYARGDILERREAPPPVIEDLTDPGDSADYADIALVSLSNDGELGLLSRSFRYEGGRVTNRVVFTTWDGSALSGEEDVFTFAEDCVVDERTCRDTTLGRSVRLGDGSMVFIVESEGEMRTQQVYVAQFD
jgi:hypothetical protein